MPRPRRDRVAAFVRRSRRLVAIVGFGTMLLGYGWLRYIDINPDSPRTAQSWSGPNAYSDFARAGALLKDDKLIGDMLTSITRRANQSAPAEMGNRGMAGLEATGSKPAAYSQIVADGRVYSRAETEAVLKENALALQALREGLWKSYQAPPVRSFNATMPYYAVDRSLARLLRLEAGNAEERGDWGTAAQSSLDAIELGMNIQNGSGAIGKLTGIACEAIGRAALWQNYEHLSASDARAAALRLERIMTKSVPLVATLQEDKLSSLASILESMRTPGWRWKLIATDSTPPNWQVFVRLLPYSKKRIAGNLVRHFDIQIEAAAAPYIPPSQRAPEVQEVSDPVNDLFFPAFGGLRLRDDVDTAENGLLLATLALRAYRLDHGGYPDNLKPLEQSYLNRLPGDPFSNGKGFLYRTSKSRYILYSVGPDGTDNGGTPIQNAPNDMNGNNGNNGNTVNIQQESTGDIIAGMNRN